MLNTPNTQPEGLPPAGGQGVEMPPAASSPVGGAPPMLHDVTVVRRKNYGCAHVEPVPPEEFGIARQAKSIQDSGYCFHRTWKTQEDLIALGYDEDQVKSLPFGDSNRDTSEAQARDTVAESSETDNSLNPPTRRIRVTEHYALLDYEQNGKASLYRVTTAGSPDVVLKRDGKDDIEPVDMPPFAGMTPIPMPHRFYGRSLADIVMDLQRIKTSVWRGLLDNIYLSNNQRLEVSEAHAHPKTIEDVLNNRPGGIVRTKQPGGINPIPNQPVGDFAFPMIEYIDQVREWRTGVVKQGQGIDADALQNQSATAVNKVYSAAQARMKLIARIFAETGIKDLFSLLHATIRKNATKADTVRLRNKWVEVDPRDWKKRDDLTISVGLGSGGKTEQMMFWGNILNMQKEAILLPGQNIVKPMNIYNSLKKFMESGGEKAIEPYWSDPSDPQNPAPPSPPDPKTVEAQGKVQLQAQSQQHDQQMQVAKAAGDQQMAQQQLQNDMQKHAAEMALKRDQMAQELILKREQLQAELQLKQQQMAAELEVQREIGLAGARARVASAAVSSDVHVGGEPG